MEIDAFRVLDKLLFGKILKLPSDDEIREAIEFVGQKSGDCAYVMIDAATEDLDAKATALLTHISILVAGLLVMYSNGSGYFKLLILVELCLYLILAILCLRVIRFVFTYLHSNHMNEDSVYTMEFIKRGVVYNFISSATVFVTLAMIATLIAGAIRH